MAEPDIVFRNFKKKIKEYGWDFEGSWKDRGDLAAAVGMWLDALSKMKGVPASDLIKFGFKNPLAMGMALVSEFQLFPLITSFIEACIEAGVPSSDVLNVDPQPDNADKDRWKKVKGITGFYTVSFNQKTPKIKLIGKASNVVPATRLLLTTAKEIIWSAKTYVTTEIERNLVNDDVPKFIIRQQASGRGTAVATTHASIYLAEGKYKLSLNSYFSALCQVESHINENQSPTSMKDVSYDFYGINHASGSLPEKGMVISGGMNGASEKGNASVKYYFVCY